MSDIKLLYDAIMEVRDEVSEILGKPIPEDCTEEQLTEMILDKIMNIAVDKVNDALLSYISNIPYPGYAKGGIIHNGDEIIIRKSDIMNSNFRINPEDILNKK